MLYDIFAVLVLVGIIVCGLMYVGHLNAGMLLALLAQLGG